MYLIKKSIHEEKYPTTYTGATIVSVYAILVFIIYHPC